MKKKKYIILTLIFSFLCIDKIYADCSQQMQNEYEKIKDQYKVTATYDSVTKTYTIRVKTADNDNFGYGLGFEYDPAKCTELSKTEFECKGMEPGTSISGYVVGNTNECRDIFREDVIELEKNNQFYGDPLCEGIEEFVLCQEMYDKEIDRETFESRIETYKESKKEEKNDNKEEQPLEQKENNKPNLHSNYLKDNLKQIIIITIFVILIIITIIITTIRTRRRDRLE